MQTEFENPFVTNQISLLRKLHDEIRGPSEEEILEHINQSNDPDNYLQTISIIDGWKNRITVDIDNGDVEFMFKGYDVVCNDTKIMSIKISPVLEHQLHILKLIFHINENGGRFEYNYIKNIYDFIFSLLNTHCKILPSQIPLKRSYNVDQYREVAETILLEGWDNRTTCYFVSDTYIVKYENKIYIIDLRNNNIYNINIFYHL